MSEWKQYKDPAGENYYYNTLTKVSTRTKPKDFGLTVGEDSRRTPVYALPLKNQWNLIICEDGTKFYHQTGSNCSHYRLPDRESQALLNSVDPMLLSLLIGVARGYSIRGDRDVYSEVLELLVAPNEHAEEEEEEEEEIEPHAANIEKSNHGGDIQKSEKLKILPQSLVTAYSSSEDEDEADEADAEEVVQEPELNGTLLKTQFINLLDESNIDPYSTWSIQSKRIIHDPRYHAVSSDADRQQLFQDWCSQQFALGKQMNDTQTREMADEEDSDLDPAKYHYLAHIVSKAVINPNTLFYDIKREHKALFKQLEIKKHLTKKQQEQFVSKILVYYKRMSEKERESLFCKKVSEIITFPELTKSLEDVIEATIPEDSFELESQLLELENQLLILNEQKNSIIQDNVIYYILGIKEKLHALRKIVKDHYSI